MTQAAAFRATYSDFKLIKTRGVVSISFEVPLEQVDLAYQVLGGMPDASAERWFAVAKLNGSSAGRSAPEQSTPSDGGAADPCGESPDRPHKVRKPVAEDRKLAQQAGICCADPVFRRFLMEDRTPEDKWPATPFPDENEAAREVREICGVNSRAWITPGTDAATSWHELYGRFMAWKLVA